MNPTWALVFVKAPSPGLVKTRLLSVLSAEEAAALYRTLVRDTLEALAAVPNLHRVVAYAADPAFPDLTWLGAYPMVRQEGETLGARLQHAFAWAFAQGAARVIAVGSDAPALSPDWLREACEALARVDVVLGPTRDGGYQLIGLRRLSPELFADMPWSTSALCDRTLERAACLGLRARCLAPVEDLDTPDDLRRYLASRSR
ncbi:MAG: TIGR04282 family arsenosugar biosynthesis glycosyltransferase [Candidatus Omnitrophica bacterium]|nr:TIGR04282 family arsenosugar biosynthesis glycosyltransferase [Candidatus Omnitrophota bacterium]